MAADLLAACDGTSCDPPEIFSSPSSRCQRPLPLQCSSVSVHRCCNYGIFHNKDQVCLIAMSSVQAKWIVGKVIGTSMAKTAKVRVTRMVLDNYLLKYYNKRKPYFAHDAQKQCTVGDVVPLKALPERRSKHVRHKLAEIIFKVGRVVDPLTGKLCAGTTFQESLEDIHLSAGSSSQEERKAES